MAKKIVMIAPFDVLTGNLSGQQDLKYAENNNPAYEAPNGSQGARNYKTRYIGARRADGTTYFSVRQKNTAVLNNKTRLAMGLTGVTQACWASITEATRQQVAAIVASVRALDPTNPEYASTAKCWNARCRRMLQYREAQFVIAGPAGSFTYKNPFKLNASDAHSIKTSVWLKFANLFAWDEDTDLQTQVVTKLPGGAYFSIDGTNFFVGKQKVNGEVINGGITQGKGSPNPNLDALYVDVTIDDSQADDVLYHGIPVYNAQGEIQQGETPIIDGQKLTTIAPES